MDAPTLIYCASGNRRFAQIAIDAGFHYGAQLPGTAYFPIYFADQDWKKPNRTAYVNAISRYQPHMASVLDWERPEQLPEVLAWAEDIAPFVEVVMIIPKVQDQIYRIPRSVGGKTIRLGYSVPTRFGGTSLPVWQFTGWDVHLLGGSPHAQMRCARYMRVVSADGNMAQKLGIKGMYWTPGNSYFANNRYWPTLREAGIYQEIDAPYVAFELSCKNIMSAWKDGKWL